MLNTTNLFVSKNFTSELVYKLDNLLDVQTKFVGSFLFIDIKLCRKHSSLGRRPFGIYTSDVSFFSSSLSVSKWLHDYCQDRVPSSARNITEWPVISCISCPFLSFTLDYSEYICNAREAYWHSALEKNRKEGKDIDKWLYVVKEGKISATQVRKEKV